VVSEKISFGKPEMKADVLSLTEGSDLVYTLGSVWETTGVKNQGNYLVPVVETFLKVSH
jgi:hypothetical protein